MNDLIRELEKIRNALGHGPDPRLRPAISRGRSTAPSPERISGTPLVDGSGWAIDDADRWDEKQTHAKRLIEEGRVTTGGVSESGIDALAWYSSFHDYQNGWGIYIPISSLALLDSLYLAHLPLDRDRRLTIAWQALLLHEQAHFAVDYACAWFEVMLTAPIRREFTSRFSAKPPLRAMETVETYLEIEEATANAYMLRQFRRSQPRAVFHALEQFVRQQPAGYRDGANALDDAAFDEAAAETIRSYLALWAVEHRLDLQNPALRLTPLLSLGNPALLAEIPVYLLDDAADVGLAPGAIRLIQAIREVIETDAFERQYKRQQPAIQKAWSRKKEEIKIQLPPPPRFEKLKDRMPPTWSLRLNDGHRVHLEPPAAGTTAWRAVSIGGHKEMGHG